MTNVITAITMPKWGIEMTEGTINEWHFKVGQRVNKGDALLEVETEKIVNTVEAPASGVLRRIVADTGETRPVGSLIAIFAGEETSDADVEAFASSFRGATVSFEPDEEPRASVTIAPAGGAMPSASAAAASSTGEPDGDVRISPIARRLAERLGVDLAKVKGTGRNGRISKEDVEAYAATMTPNATKADATAGSAQAIGASADNEPRRVPLSGMRATIAKRLLESTSTIPHYRLSIDIDATGLAARRKALADQGTRATLNDLVVRAAALALTEHPRVNAQFHTDVILEFAHADIAIAVATENGLITPVIRSADLKSVQEIATISRDLATRAANGSLTRDDIAAGTFTISNLGMHGITRFDAIINPPQVAILAVGAAQERVVVRNGSPAVGTVMTLTLSADHRVVDGAIGAAFLATLRKRLEQPDSLDGVH